MSELALIVPLLSTNSTHSPPRPQRPGQVFPDPVAARGHPGAASWAGVMGGDRRPLEPGVSAFGAVLSSRFRVQAPEGRFLSTYYVQGTGQALLISCTPEASEEDNWQGQDWASEMCLCVPAAALLSLSIPDWGNPAGDCSDSTQMHRSVRFQRPPELPSPRRQPRTSQVCSEPTLTPIPDIEDLGSERSGNLPEATQLSGGAGTGHRWCERCLRKAEGTLVLVHVCGLGSGVSSLYTKRPAPETSPPAGHPVPLWWVVEYWRGPWT